MLDPLHCFACEGAGCDRCVPGFSQPPSDVRAISHAISADFAALSATIDSIQSRLVTLNRLMVDVRNSSAPEVRPHGRD